MTDEVFELMKCFPGSKIVPCGEVVLDNKNMICLTVKGIETRDEIIYKLLEWGSRTVAKGCPYSSEKSNRQWRRSLLLGFNNYLKTNFTENDIWFVYEKLGNAINHDRTVGFVKSNYDMDWLMKEGAE